MARRFYLGSDQGSLAPMGIGLFALTLTLMLIIIAASSLFVFQKRLTNYSESAALYIASTGKDLQGFTTAIGGDSFKSLKVTLKIADDNRTVQVNSCAVWSAPIALVDRVTQTEICSHAAARAE